MDPAIAVTNSVSCSLLRQDRECCRKCRQTDALEGELKVCKYLIIGADKCQWSLCRDMSLPPRHSSTAISSVQIPL
jgi:hypothetical protein